MQPDFCHGLLSVCAGFRTAAAVALGAIVTAGFAAAQPEPTLDVVLARAGVYVTEFQRQFSGIVAEERYVQDVKAFASRCTRAGYATLNCSSPPADPVRSELRSDLLLVKAGAAGEWLQYRDVFEVDGQPVRDRTDRLTRLFLDPSASSANQIARIRDESARYNIGDIRRNLNVPIFALTFLVPANQPRFKFRRTKERMPATVGPLSGAEGAFRVSTEVWVIQYQEVQRGTLIRTTKNKDLPSRGRVWIEPSSGHVLMTELVAENHELRATIDVSYQSEPLLGLLVPIEMREWYDGHRTGSRIEAVATYGRFRQFQVNVDEKFLIK
jgi:hypothetical protein